MYIGLPGLPGLLDTSRGERNQLLVKPNGADGLGAHFGPEEPLAFFGINTPHRLVNNLQTTEKVRVALPAQQEDRSSEPPVDRRLPLWQSTYGG
ncbi:unannotated protein [freshwater metagenome]|uniref:Unannotated protein n=1 Tax=freshwater metagenome TaxID=449393 RepID=A0A6J6S5L0_9ZZZZ